MVELKDIDLDVNLHISDSQNDQLLDVWFDNIITDARVHNEIKVLQGQLKELEYRLIAILDMLKKYI